MPETEQFTIGAIASCSDGTWCDVTRVVVDPVAAGGDASGGGTETPKGPGRLVPLDLVDDVSDLQAELYDRTVRTAGTSRESQFLPGSGGHADYTVGVTLAQPFFGLTEVIGDVPQAVTYDTLPIDEVAIRRASRSTRRTVGSE